MLKCKLVKFLSRESTEYVPEERFADLDSKGIAPLPFTTRVYSLMLHKSHDIVVDLKHRFWVVWI